jgi:hypothetical protein
VTDSLSTPPAGDAREETLFGIGLLVVCALGMVLRAMHLDIPMRYDETITYMAYASQGWEVITTVYDTPNNHVLHTLLVSWLTDWFGPVPIIIRLPAFFAGCMLIPMAAWVGFHAHGRSAGLVAATIVATSPVLIEFSTNARGYTLLALCTLLAVGIGQRLLDKESPILWFALVEVGVIGFFTLPIMALPWAGLTLWLGFNLALESGGRSVRVRRLAVLFGANLLVGAISIALYLGILMNAGVDALVANRFVEPQTLRDFFLAAPGAARDVIAHWTRGVPWPLSIAATAVLLAGVRWRPRRHPFSFALAVVVGAVAVMLVQRNFGEARTWLWVLPLVAVGCGIGVAETVKRLDRAQGVVAGTAASALIAIVMVAQILVKQPVRGSLETGAFPEVEEVVEGIMERFRPGDLVMSDFVTSEPIKFYVNQYDIPRRVAATGPVGARSWVVLNKRGGAETDRLDRRVARLGGPNLDNSQPVFTVGEASVYLFGRPPGGPDPRLLEAIDWYTGVAGRVDDRRARTLLLEVLEDTASPLSRMWVARCHSRGRMGFVRDEAMASGIAVTVLQTVRDLADLGEVEAQFLMGTAYDEGLGVDPDPAEAIRWYRAAAERGHVLAQHNLGNIFAAGRGIEPDPEVAVYWWKLAAEQGDAITQLRLGEAHEAGSGVARNTEMAVVWYTQSAERGNEDARAALERLTN